MVAIVLQLVGVVLLVGVVRLGLYLPFQSFSMLVIRFALFFDAIPFIPYIAIVLAVPLVFLLPELAIAWLLVVFFFLLLAAVSPDDLR